MADTVLTVARPTDAVGRALFGVSRVCALLGGVLLVLCAALTTISILGHALFRAPIHGEHDLVTFGASWAVYLFLPWCQMIKGNVVVDFFLASAPARLRAALDALGSLVYGVIAAILIWRMSVGAEEVMRSGQSSAVLKVPYWTSFPVVLFCLALLFAITTYTMWRSIREARA
jgi:TRAP-type C4-dicarboxylate transport system permease small subunit